MDKLTYERIDDSTIRIDGEEYERKQRKYYEINAQGVVIERVEHEVDGPFIDAQKLYGNYFETEEKAQAVADLKRHVMKFPPVKYHENIFVFYDYFWKESDSWYETSHRWFRFMPHTSTEEDRAERLRHIKRCDDLGVLKFVI